jgi:multidrug efflux pump
MSLSSVSINRPVLATVMAIVILLFGVVGFTFLGIREFPSVDPAIITVSTSYPGANSDVIETQITEPLEQSINGIPGVRTLTSVSSQGMSRITVEFELSVDLETAANDVRDKVSQAQRRLPRDCDPPTVTKADADANPILFLTVESQKRSLLELSEIAELTLKEQLQTVSGVSAINIFGEKRYAMRLWIDPVKLAGYGLTPMDVRNAISRENVELPSGAIEGTTTQLTIRTLGLMTTPKEFNDLIIKQSGDQIVRFQDVGRAELGPEDIRGIKNDGVPMVQIAVVPQPGSNHIEIVDEIFRRLVYIQKDLPDDVKVNVNYDNTEYIRSSIREVQNTIFIAFTLVVIIIYFFLRSWRATIIPILVIPISLVGSFFIMYLAGFSINVLTLLAMVLAIGIVVDDAIVVMENIYVKVESGMTPLEAGLKGSKEIYFAIISTTITLVSVFFPIVFLQGITGRLFREFGIVMAGTVTISAFLALSLTPMVSTKLLRHEKSHSWFFRKTERFFEKLNAFYKGTLASFLNHRRYALGILIIAVGLIILLWTSIPAEMAPLEDRSQITINMSATEGATYEYMLAYADDLADLVERTIPERVRYTTMIRGGTFANIRIVLTKPDERDRTQQEIADKLSVDLRSKTKARAFVMQQSTFGSRRAGMPVQYVLQATSIEKLREILPDFMSKVNDSEILQMADVNLKFSKPELRIHINREKAITLGISTQNIGTTLQLALSGQRFGYFFMNGKQYQILGELAREDRNKPLDLKSLYVRNDKGEMIQFDNLVTLTEETAPPQLYRYNRFVAATVSSGLAPGYTISEGIEEMDRIADEVLDESFRTALAGDSKDFQESSSSLMFAFVLALILIFLVLAAQFESFRDPFVVMMTVPLAITGALFFMWYFNITMNIFSQIGIIMLIGLVSKNGILIVEFANQRKNAGMSKIEAIKYAAAARFRPILMTSLATILGISPLALGFGEGAQSRVAMGIAVIGGMIFSTMLTLYVVPAVYTYISGESKKKTDENKVAGA